MKSEVRRDKNRLNLKDVKEGGIVYTEDNNFFSKINVGGHCYRLVKPTDKVISYIPDCWDETDDEDKDCHVMGYQKWIVEDLEFFVEKRLTIHFFIAKWSTILNNPTLYNKICVDYEDEFLNFYGEE